LKIFVEDVVSLSGIWKSPGGTAKQFQCSDYDLTLTWYPGKQNTITFHGKDGEMLKEFLMRLLSKPRDKQATNIWPVNSVPTTDIEPDMQQEASGNTNDVAAEKPHCSNCEDMAIKLSEIERKLCGLYDITYKIYNSVSDSTAIGDDLGQKFCKDGHTNAIDQPNQNNERPLSEYYELTTDLEEVKLDAVINHTKLSNNISSNSKVISENTQEINQLKVQLTNMQSERQTLIKEISKQSEIIKQLSSKVDNLQNTQVIHSAQHSVRSSTSKESLNTQQTTECLDLNKPLNTPLSANLPVSMKPPNKKHNAVNTRPIKPKEKSAKKHVDLAPESQHKVHPRMPINRKTRPEEAVKPREMSQIQDKKRTTNNLNIVDIGRLPLIDTQQHKIPARITTRFQQGTRAKSKRYNSWGFRKRPGYPLID
jgi:hypothetical protein